MKSNHIFFIVVVFAALLGLTFFGIWGIPYFFNVSLPDSTETIFGSGTARAQVDKILEEGTTELGGNVQSYQKMRVRVLEGEYEGILIELDYGSQQILPDDHHFAPGDEIYIAISLRPDNQLVAYFADYVRWKPLLLLAGVFVAAILTISRWKGLRSLLALAFSLIVIIGYIIPHILIGEDPVRVSLIGAGILLGTTLYLTYGWTLKTHASVLSMLMVLIITGSLAWLFVALTHLSGYGDENAIYVMQIPGAQINMRGLLLGGMIIGALGVLDDLVTTQSSAVFELYIANPALGFGALTRAALRIGQDHVAATVNTLVLAYAGSSLPMLLLIAVGSGNYAYLINSATVAEEIVRTLVGSLGLIAAVPITTIIAALLVLHADQLGSLRRFLGPANDATEHNHVHG
jgi:uncharacterized membrane protein